MSDDLELPFRFYTREKVAIDLSGHLAGVPAAFLIGGGPSINDLDLEAMNRRGIWSMAVNNVAGHPRLRPSAFVHGDPPKKFHNGIWQDPTIAKFQPLPKMKRGRGSIRHWKDGELLPSGRTVLDCPNIWGFQRRSWFQPDGTFFKGPVSWGNLQVGVERTGLEKTACTLLMAIRVIYELGCRKIFLLGVDFDMGKKYSFEQGRTVEAIDSNNSQFRTVNGWMKSMVANGAFEEAGLEIYNTNPRSGLEAFPFCGYSDAIDHCLQGFPSEPFNLAGWYEK